MLHLCSLPVLLGEIEFDAISLNTLNSPNSKFQNPGEGQGPPCPFRPRGCFRRHVPWCSGLAILWVDLWSGFYSYSKNVHDSPMPISQLPKIIAKLIVILLLTFALKVGSCSRQYLDTSFCTRIYIIVRYCFLPNISQTTYSQSFSREQYFAKWLLRCYCPDCNFSINLFLGAFAQATFAWGSGNVKHRVS